MESGLDLALWLSGGVGCAYAVLRTLRERGRKIPLFAWAFGATGFLLRALHIFTASAAIGVVGTLALIMFGVLLLVDGFYCSRYGRE